MQELNFNTKQHSIYCYSCFVKESRGRLIFTDAVGERAQREKQLYFTNKRKFVHILLSKSSFMMGYSTVWDQMGHKTSLAPNFFHTIFLFHNLAPFPAAALSSVH